ncbi:MAG: serine hydrolase, partial [Bacteroidota bacterium]
MKNRGGLVTQVYQEAEKHRLQILYTQIDRDEENRPSFTSYEFRVDENEYFYPASTVKFPAAVLALEKLYQLKIEGLDRNTSLQIDSSYMGQSSVLSDSTAEGYQASIGHYIKKIMLVSDNDAFNRLYEFLGQEVLNQELWKREMPTTKISHRLSIALSEDENRHTNPFFFFRDTDTIYQQGPANSQLSFPELSPILLGKGEMQAGKLVEGPKDFTIKNNF